MRRMYLCSLVLIAFTGCGEQPPGSVSSADAQEAAPPVAADDASRASDDPSAKSDKDPSESDAKAPVWPNWLGPNYDGVSRETGWKSDWDADGPTELWKVGVGIGYSSVSVDAGRLYAMGYRDGKETVYCLNVENGKSLWNHSYDAPLVNNLNAGGPGATPTIDGPRLVCNGRGGRVHCYDRETGEVLWQVDLRETLGIPLPEWGFTCSPRVYGDWLLMEAGRVFALDRKTGKLIWKTKAYDPGYGTPTVFRHGEEDLVAAHTCTGLLIVKAKDGSEVARQDWDSPFNTNSTTPIVVDDLIFISTGYNVGCGLFRLQEGKLTRVYANRDMRNHFNNSVLHKGYLYGFDGNSNLGRIVTLVCMNHKTGEVAWSKSGFGCGSVLIADDKLIILSDEGTLAIAEASSKSFQPLAQAKVLSGQCWTVPVLADGRIYCRGSAGTLVCVDVRGE
ncbi:MAG: PQQ-like beta-propeller repeat protein, partial [Planctomycetales bacterium]